MIYCVIRPEDVDPLFERMVEYYRDNPNVEVIVDRRSGPDRRGHKEYGGKRVLRDRRRRRASGSFPPTDPPDERRSD